MLNAIRKGSGRPLILLHGNGESAECFCPHPEYRKTKYDVCTIDTCGNGVSPGRQGTFTIRRFDAVSAAHKKEITEYHKNTGSGYGRTERHL